MDVNRETASSIFFIFEYCFVLTIFLFDPEGGRIFIVIDISDQSTPKVVVCEAVKHIRPPSGVGVGAVKMFYKRVTPSGSTQSL